MDSQTLAAILNSFPFPITFVDLDHVIRFLNRRAEYHYYTERGYKDLLNKSVFDCHSANSKEQILEAV